MSNIHPTLMFVSLLFLERFAIDDESNTRGKAKTSSLAVNIPVIREVKPSSAKVGEVVKIEGENFATERPTVFFNGVEAVIKKIEADELRVFVPQGATTGPLLVKLGSQQSNPILFVIEGTTEATVSVKTDTMASEQPRASRPISFSMDIQPLFEKNCTNCHGGSAGLFLDAGESYASLVNVLATKGCTSEKRVEPGSSSASVLFKRISGSSCGTQMPKKAPPLSADEIRAIKDWIDQGALNN